MEQLSLFNNTIPHPRRTAPKRLPRDTHRQLHNVQRELWTQESEAEKELVLFFLDIRNFTPLTEKHQAFEVIHIIKKLFSTFQNIIRIYHGTVIETSGDGFYAVFGLDRDLKEAVNGSVNAGRAILQSLEKMNQHSFEHNLGQRIEVGIGVHVGKVAMGTLHVGTRDHFVVMGYAVNVASRLQAATKELNNNFIVSSAVFQALENPPADTIRTTVTLKGVTEPCELCLIGRRY
jgi:adenylate cyclase